MSGGRLQRWLPSLPHPGWVLLAVLAAVGLNLLKLEVPGGARVWLGGFVAMPCLLLLPARWGVLVAALAFVPTVVVLGQPFALLLGVAEALWLAVLVRRLGWHVVLADALFWAAAGLPLAWLLFAGVAGLPFELVIAVVAKQALTQLAAAAMAQAIVQARPMRTAAGRREPRRIALGALVFNYLFVLTAVPLVLVGLGFSVLAQRVAATAERTRMLDAATDTSRQVNVFLTLHQAALISAARVIERQPTAGAELIEEIRRAHPALITLLVSDPEGRIVQTAPNDVLPRLRGSSVADRDYFRAARDHDQPFVSGVFRGRGFGRDLLVALSVPLHDAEGKFAGIVQGSLEIERFGRMALHPGEPGTRMILADARGRVIHADPATGLRALQDLRFTSLQPLLGPGAQPAITHDVAVDGEPMRRMRSYAARCEPFGLVVIAQWPVLATWQELRHSYALIAVIFAGVLGGALLVGRLARRRLAGPLEHFARGAEAQAHHGAPTEIPRPADPLPREVALVFDAFNHLARRLQATHAELRRSNAELDRRVEERTAEADTARRQAEAASRSKSEFLAMTSHEIRTPLNAIIGLAAPTGAAPRDPVVGDRLELIHRAGQRLLGVINDLLDLSRVEAGKLELSVAPLELAALERDLMGLFALMARKQGLTLTWQMDPGVPRWVQTDGARLQQVLVNLVGNALKFTRVGGVQVRVESRAGEAGRVRLRFAVSDTGPGIPLAQQARLFEPFTRLPGAAESSVPGSGLGLTISRRLVELLGGTLQLRSEAGQGAEFSFEFDAERAEPPPRPCAPTAPPATAAGWRVLAADDNSANLEVLRLILEPRCARLECVESGAAALEAMRREPFDVALLDLEMPDVDGLAVARRWRAEAPAGAAGCELIAVSAYPRRDRWAQCAEAGFAAFVEKPIDRAELLREIAAARH